MINASVRVPMHRVALLLGFHVGCVLGLCAGGKLTRPNVQRRYQRRHRVCNGRQCMSCSTGSG